MQAYRTDGMKYGARQSGVSLIELMIALVLGLVVVGGASAVFLSNKRTYGTSETLNRIQENERASFEIMSRDLREADGTPCSTAATHVSMLRNPAMNTWASSFDRGIQGYDAGSAATGTPRLAGTDAVDVYSWSDGVARVIDKDVPSSVTEVNDNSGFEVGDVVAICNADYVMSFQITHKPKDQVGHNPGAGGGDGNCGKFQVIGCEGGKSAESYCFTKKKSGTPCDEYGDSPAFLARLSIIRWFVADNGRGGTSLYRAQLVNRGGVVQLVAPPQEISEGATGMNVRYLRARQNDFESAAAVTAADTPNPGDGWESVVAVRVEIRFEGTAGALRGDYIEGTDGDALSRTATNVVMLRNREGAL